VFRQGEAGLDTWLGSRARKPLVLRGARQVGKTWLVRDLATRSGRRLVELNFERDPRLARHFESNDPSQILGELSLALGQDIVPEKNLLFLDEIQAVGHLLAKLRWFAEDLPSLPVIAAGSLLDFTLADHAFSMPVGRISYRHVEPMGFPEYLRAHGQERLLAVLTRWRPPARLSPAAHEKATEWFERYAMVGGMPAVVAEDVAGSDALTCRTLQRDLVATYRADFAKYAGRMDRSVLDTVLLAAAQSVGRKFVYARVGEGVKQHQAKNAIELLAKARLCHLVRHSSANGLPLGGEAKDSFRKALLVDVGIFHGLLGTPAAKRFPAARSLAPQLRGQLAEQMAGQALRLLGDATGDGPDLFYWQREGGRPGEIDYLVQIAGRIIPIELKAGASGAMKSLHQFMFDKGLDLAVRLDTNPPSSSRISHTTTQGNPVSFTLVSLPTYMTFALPEVLATLF
jgi:predicted AAA+ superfamily ATPase